MFVRIYEIPVYQFREPGGLTDGCQCFDVPETSVSERQLADLIAVDGHLIDPDIEGPRYTPWRRLIDNIIPGGAWSAHRVSVAGKVTISCTLDGQTEPDPASIVSVPMSDGWRGGKGAPTPAPPTAIRRTFRVFYVIC